MRGVILVLWMCGCAPQVVEGALEGPGVDDSGRMITDADELLVGLTHLQVRNAPGPGGTFGDHADAIGTWLFEEEPEGWLGAAFRNEGRLSWWTMTVWESEDAMAAFVVSDLHLAAMQDFDAITVGGESRALWVPTAELPLTWDRAQALLLADPDFQAGASDWYTEGQ